MRILSLLFLCFLFISAFAQKVEVCGVVQDNTKRLLPDVIVKVTDGKKTYAFTVTDASGNYILSYNIEDVKGKALSVVFSHISFDQKSVILSDEIMQHHDVLLIPKNIALKEVKVRAKSLSVNGDTLKYNLASFLSKGAVSLEDGLKKLPGINISSDGEILYMGKGISNFYIEGMDMLGGRYNLATKNIPAQYASQVEVIRHHKERKIDADEESNDIAINVKLNRKAKFKPFGQPEFGIGYRDDDILVALGLTGMMFTDKFQILASGKFCNDGNFGSYDVTDHFTKSSENTLATSLLGRWSGGRPPIGEYLHEKTGFGSLNYIRKHDDDRTLRINANYSYENRANEFATQTIYFANGQNVSISERQHPSTELYKPSLFMRYVRNSIRRYISEELQIKASFEKNENPVQTNFEIHNQYREATSIFVANNFSTSVKTNKNKYFLLSQIEFQRTPEIVMQMNNILQNGQSSAVKTNHNTTLTFNADSKWRVLLPLGIKADFNYLTTTLAGTDNIDNLQEIKGWIAEPVINPSFEWNSANKRTYAFVGVGIRGSFMHNSSLIEKNANFAKLFIEPEMKLRYQFSGTSELNLFSSFHHNAGDLLNLLTLPVQRDYRNTSIASGIIAESETWSANLLYKYQIPFHYFSMNIQAEWDQGKRNILTSQQVDGTEVSVGSIAKDSYNRNANARVMITKNYLPVNTKLEASVSGFWASSESLSQQKFITTYSQGYSLAGKIVVSPSQWSEISGQVRYNQHFTRYSGTHNKYDDTAATASMSFFPTKQIEVKAMCDYSHTMIAISQHKDATLLGASVQYKAKQATWKLNFNNLLDTKHYSYTTYNGTDCYYSNCSLLGRTVMLSCSLNITKAH